MQIFEKYKHLVYVGTFDLSAIFVFVFSHLSKIRKRSGKINLAAKLRGHKNNPKAREQLGLFEEHLKSLQS